MLESRDAIMELKIPSMSKISILSCKIRSLIM